VTYRRRANRAADCKLLEIATIIAIPLLVGFRNAPRDGSADHGMMMK
jgi:hypothetical protein